MNHARGTGQAMPAALIVLLASLTTPHAHAATARPGKTLRIFAAASLAESFGEIVRLYERGHPGTAVQLNLAGSQQLAVQLEQGAIADVFAPADEHWMAYARDRSLVSGEVTVFAHNRLIVIVPRSNPARVGSLRDLTRRGVKLVLGAEAVPVGRYSRDVLQNLSKAKDFPSDFAARVLANVVSEEENVKSVVGKVQLGEADAGIVYRSDVTPALSRYVRVFEIPDSTNVLAAYAIAVTSSSRLPEEAREFVALVFSRAGQRILERRGLLPVSRP